MKYYTIWILIYVVALATVKSSICITILRIASNKLNMRIAVYVLLAVTWASFFITFIGTLLYCQPVNAMWNTMLVLTGKGKCAPVKTFIIIAHTATVSTILTDLALVVVPAIMLWNTQMKRQAKLQAFGLLSFASVASIITMVRIPYINEFSTMTDLPCECYSLPLPLFLTPLTLNSLGCAHYALLKCRSRYWLCGLFPPLAKIFFSTRCQRQRFQRPKPKVKKWAPNHKPAARSKNRECRGQLGGVARR
jgi:hypothetical protein